MHPFQQIHRVARILASQVRCFLWILVLGSMVANVMAAERLVASAQELTAASRTARPGDTLLLKDGEWRDVDLVFEANGQPDKPIILRAQTIGRVVITGKSRLRFGGRHLVVDGLWFRDCGGLGDTIELRRDSKTPAESCRLTRCAVTQSPQYKSDTEARWVSVYGHSNRVDHCYMAGKTSPGATLVVWVGDSPNDHRIEANHFGPRPRLGKNGGESIRVGTSDVSMNVSRTIVEGNLFQECNGEVEIVSNKSCENTYRYNTFLHCEGAMTLRHGNRCVVAGNFFLGGGKKYTGGVRVIGEDHRIANNYFADLGGEEARSPLTLMNGIPQSPLHGYFQVKRATIAFNTFVNCKSGWVLGEQGDSKAKLPPEDCVFAANIITKGADPITVTPIVRTSWKGNIFHGNGPSVDGIRRVDPLLALAADGLWRPRAESPAAGAAAELDWAKEDIDGQVRSGKWDAGCDQMVSGQPKRHPLKVTDVGPEWLKQR